jgi:hypothetical protein
MRRSSAARLLRLWVRIPPGTWMTVCCDGCVLSGRGLYDGLITRPEDSYRLWRVVVSDQETSKTRRLKPATGLWKYTQGCNARKTQIYSQTVWIIVRPFVNLCSWYSVVKHYMVINFIFIFLCIINLCFKRPTRCNPKQSLFILLPSHSTCFGCLPHPSSGLHKL